jgi:hypothetical protein
MHALAHRLVENSHRRMTAVIHAPRRPGLYEDQTLKANPTVVKVAPTARGIVYLALYFLSSGVQALPGLF